MSLPTTKALSNSTLVPLWLLLCDFATFAGTKGLKASFFVFLGAVVEGVGLALLIPFFSLIVNSQNNAGWVEGASAWLFALFSAERCLAKLSVLVALFVMLMVARAVIITVRDLTIVLLEIGFIQQIVRGSPAGSPPRHGMSVRTATKSTCHSSSVEKATLREHDEVDGRRAADPLINDFADPS